PQSMVPRGKLVQAPERVVAELVIEPRRLKTERIHVGVPGATPARLLLRRLHERRAEALAPMLVGDPQQADGEPTEKGLAHEPTDDVAPLAQRDRQRPVIDLADSADVVGAQAFDDLPPRRAVHVVELERHHTVTPPLSSAPRSRRTPATPCRSNADRIRRRSAAPARRTC